MFKRYEGNPILSPIPGSDWEAEMIFNPATIDIEGKIYIIYRVRTKDGKMSKFGLAITKDGFKIDERLDSPILESSPGEPYEKHGIEDPRVAIFNKRLYLCYTAFGIIPNMFDLFKLRESGEEVAHERSQIQVGITSIALSDFLNRRWQWEKPHFPFYRVDNKNACLFPRKIGGKFALLHRISPHIWIAYSDNLKDWYDINLVMQAQEDWEYFKLGTGAPPIEIEEGWLQIYHAVDNKFVYRLGLALLDKDDPTKVLLRGKIPIMVPETDYELKGVVPMVVYTGGAVLRGETVIMHYGGADTVIGAATAKVSGLMDWLKKNS